MVVPEDIMQLYMRKNTKLTSLHLQIRVTTEVLIHVFYKFKGFKQKGDLLMYWDNGASLCFITNKKAKEEKLKGISAQLSVVKVGGVNEKLISRKYKLTLIDKKEQELQIDVSYKLGWNTSSIQKRNKGRNNKANRRSRCINWF